jgi:hypothetical protein
MNSGKRRNAFWLLVLLVGLNAFSVYSASVQQLCRADQGKISYENPLDNNNKFFLKTSEKENTASRLQEDFAACTTSHTNSAIPKSLLIPTSLKRYQLKLTHPFYIRYSRLLI